MSNALQVLTIVAVAVIFASAGWFAAASFYRRAFFPDEKGSEDKTIRDANEYVIRCYREVTAMCNELRKWRHDYHNHTQVMLGLAELGDLYKLKDYLFECNEQMITFNVPLCTGCAAADALLSIKKQMAEDAGVIFRAIVNLPSPLNISAFHLATILGNLLDNAIEACAEVDPSDAPFISLSIEPNDENLLIRCVNSTADTSTRTGVFKTTKKGSTHGWGLRSIDAIVKRYGGTTVREQRDGLFASETLIPLLDEAETVPSSDRGVEYIDAQG